MNHLTTTEVTYQNIIELYIKDPEFAVLFDVEKDCESVGDLINYFDTYGDKPEIVDRVLSDVIDSTKFSFECSDSSEWRRVKITIKKL
jgi:hypothetical protein